MIDKNRGSQVIGFPTRGFLLMIVFMVGTGSATAQQPKMVVGDPVTPTVSRPASGITCCSPGGGSNSRY